MISKKNLCIYGQYTYKTLSGRCMFIISNNIINKRYYYCHIYYKPEHSYTTFKVVYINAISFFFNKYYI